MPERHIMVQRRMSAPTSAVWAVVSDFPDLASHWNGLRSTRALGAASSSSRWAPGTRPSPSGRTVTGSGRRTSPNTLVPFPHVESTLTLESDGDGTLGLFDYRYVPRGGPLGHLTGPLIDKRLTATFADMLAATEEAALGRSR